MEYVLLLALLSLFPSTDVTLTQVQDALARGNRAEARALLDRLPPLDPLDPDTRHQEGRRALLSATLLPAATRDQGLLEVAQTWREDDLGLSALVACLHRLEKTQDPPNHPLPYVVQEYEEADREEPGPLVAQARITRRNACLDACQDLVRYWSERAPEDPRTQLARELLESVQRSGRFTVAGELRLLAGTSIPVPSPLAEPLRVQVRAHPDGSLVRDLPIPTPSPRFALPPLGPGRYLLDLQSAQRSWHRQRLLHVSDLHLTTHRFADGLAVLATLRGVPAPEVSVTCSWSDSGGPRVLDARTDANGVALLPFPSRNTRDTLHLSAIAGSHTAESTVEDPYSWDWREPFAAHVMTDRPIYRAGETVQGRVVLREHVADPADGLFGRSAWVPRSEPVALHRLVLTFREAGGRTRNVSCRTDESGVAVFDLPLTDKDRRGTVSVDIQILDQAGDVQRKLRAGRCFEIQDFRRPPLLLTVEWPKEPCDPAQDPVLRVHGKHPSGDAAAGLAGWVEASMGGTSERREFQLDASGTASLRIALSELTLRSHPGQVHALVEVTAADGQVVRQSRTMALANSDQPGPEQPGFTFTLPGTAVVGRSATVGVHGPPGQTVLLSVARETLFEVHTVILDEAGRANVSFVPPRSWWPEVGLVASLAESHARSLRRTLVLDDPAEALALDLTMDRRFYAPGGAARWTVTTRNEAGEPVPATVTMTVTDAALAGIARDYLRPPHRAMRPDWFGLLFSTASGPLVGSRWHALGELMEGGRIPSPFVPLPHRPVSPNAGGGGGVPASTALPRRDFKPTAFFAAALRTDAEGRAKVAFDWPDDLTTWQVTVVAIDDGRRTAMLTQTTETRREASVDLLTPRFLRSGDRLDVGLMVAAEPGRREDLSVHTEVSGSVDQVPDGAWLVLTAGEPGIAILDASLSDDTAVLDRVIEEFPVLVGSVQEVLAHGISVDGHGTLEVPTSDLPCERLVLDLDASGDGMLREAAEFLTGYPYGCAEQTASRLVPVALAAHARRGLSGPEQRSGASLLDLAQAHRLEKGLVRLAHLQQEGGGFAWWDGDRTNVAMSAPVFRVLALLADAGLDVTSMGVRTDPDLRVFEWTAKALSKSPVDPAVAELCIARLLLHPQHSGARETIQSLLAREDVLPIGLRLRAARALAVAGDPGPARALILDRGSRPDSGPWNSQSDDLEESPAARLAAWLDLLLEVAPEDPGLPAIVHDLESLARQGCFRNTLGTAAALVALSRERARHPAPVGRGPLSVQVVFDGVPQKLRLEPEGEWRASLELPTTIRQVEVHGPTGRRVSATLRKTVSEPGATAMARSHGLALTRQLRLVKGGEVLLGEVPAQTLLEVHIELRGPVGLRHVVVDCPLPAGFEPVRAPGRAVYHDDRVVVALSSLYSERFEYTFRMVASSAGVVQWPPTTAEAMYASEWNARTAGEALRILPRDSGAALAEVSVLGRTPFLEQRDQLMSRLAGEVASGSMSIYKVRWALDGLANLPLEDEETRPSAALEAQLGLARLENDQGPQALELLAGLDVPADRRRRVIQQRWEGLANNEHRADRLLVQPVLQAWTEECVRDGIAVGDQGEGRIAEAVRWVDQVMATWTAAPVEARSTSLGLIAELLVVPEWPRQGSAPGSAHQHLRQHLHRWLERLAPLGPGTPFWRGEWHAAHPSDVAHLFDLRASSLPPDTHAGHAAELLSWLLDLGFAGDQAEDRVWLGEEILDDTSTRGRGLPAWEPVLVRVLEEGPPDWWSTAFWSLSDEVVHRLPSRILLRTVVDEGNVRAARDLLARGGIPPELLLDHVPGEDDHSSLGWGLDLDEEVERQVADHLVTELAEGPYSMAELVRHLVRPGPPGARQVTLRALARRGVTSVSFSADDPAAERLATELTCRQGDEEAAQRVRDWLGDQDSMEWDLIQELSWALEPQATVRDLAFLDLELSEDARATIVARATPEEVAALILRRERPEDEELESPWIWDMLSHLSAAQADALCWPLMRGILLGDHDCGELGAVLLRATEARRTGVLEAAADLLPSEDVTDLFVSLREATGSWPAPDPPADAVRELEGLTSTDRIRTLLDQMEEHGMRALDGWSDSADPRWREAAFQVRARLALVDER